jgi:hypothetical protein
MKPRFFQGRRRARLLGCYGSTTGADANRSNPSRRDRNLAASGVVGVAAVDLHQQRAPGVVDASNVENTADLALVDVELSRANAELGERSRDFTETRPTCRRAEREPGPCGGGNPDQQSGDRPGRRTHPEHRSPEHAEGDDPAPSRRNGRTTCGETATITAAASATRGAGKSGASPAPRSVQNDQITGTSSTATTPNSASSGRPSFQ